MKRWTGSEWLGFGGSDTAPGLYPGDYPLRYKNNDPFIALDSSGYPVIASRHYDGEFWQTTTLHSVRVTAWSGSGWIGFDNSNTGSGISLNDSSKDDFIKALTMDESGRIYVASYRLEEAILRQWSGSAWQELDLTSLSAAGFEISDMEFDSAHRLVVVGYRVAGQAIEAYRLTGSTWESLGEVPGEPPFSSVGSDGAGTYDIHLALDSEDTPYVVYAGSLYGVQDVYAFRYLETMRESDYTYTHDEVLRLTEVDIDNGITIGYEYDSAGNRKQKDVTSQLFLSRGNLSPQSGGIDNSSVDRPMMQLGLDVSGDEDLLLDRIQFMGSGSGDDSAAISEARLWRDVNGDGAVDGGDLQLGSSASFGGDNGAVAFEGLAETLPAGQRTNLLLTYTFNGAASSGHTFRAAVMDHSKIVAEGVNSGDLMYALGTPVEGATLTISADTAAPTFAGLATATPSDGAVLLAWSPATDPSTPITYCIWRSTVPFEGTVAGPPTSTTEDLSFLVDGLVNGQVYYFVVRAQDSVGNRDENTEERSATPVGIMHAVTATATNGAVVQSPDLPAYAFGSYVTLAASGDPGYDFAGWSGDVPPGHESASPLTLLVDGDKTLDAAFARATGTVVVSATPDDATWSFVDGDGVPHPGGVGDAVVPDVPTGQIIFTWDPYDGRTSPPMAFPELVSGGTVTISGVYGTPLSFTNHPQSQRLYTGDTAVFSVETVDGLGFLSYQWKFDDGEKALTDIVGDGPMLTIPAVTLSDSGPYWCEVSDQVPATYVSDTALLEVADHLEITVQPEGGEYIAKDSHTFSVTVTGGFLPLTYTWKQDEDVVGNDAEYALDSLAVSDSGVYSVEVMDDNGEVIVSESVQLTVEAGIPAMKMLGLAVLMSLCALLGVPMLRRVAKG